jgi:GNAT superfamily N-acetyltransferase
MCSQARDVGSALAIRHVLAAEHARLRELRLSALERNPEAFGSTYAADAAQPVAWWERWASASGDGVVERTFVLVDGEDRWLGMAFARFRGEEPAVAWLGGMWIAPEARRCGGARLLCQACLRWSTERGAEELMLTVVVGNDAALSAYLTAGFAIRDRTTHSHGARALDEFIMTQALGAASAGAGQP